MPSYHPPMRKDRPTRGGGVAIYVKESIYYKRRPDLELPGLEAVWAQVTVKNKSYLVGTFYRSDTCLHYWELIDNSIALAIDTNINVIALGDFNINLLNRIDPTVENLKITYNLFQVISEPTRITPTSSTLIDLIFVTCPDLVRASGVSPPFCSDHCSVHVLLKSLKQNKSTYERIIFDYNSIDIPSFQRNAQEVNWETVLNDNINVSAKNVVESISNICKNNIPNKKVVIRPNDAPWMNGYIRKLMRKRNRIHKKAKRSNSRANWEKFRHFRNFVISEIRRLKKEHNEKLDNTINTKYGSKIWWRIIGTYMKNSNKRKSFFPHIEQNGIVFENDIEKANLINDYFVGMATVDNPDDNIDVNDVIPDSGHSLQSICLEKSEIKDILLSLDVSKATGPDGISNRVLKLLSEQLSEPLRKLFNNSLSQSIFPEVWKCSSVVPIHKKNDIHTCSNYRPITLTSTLSKVFEKCVFKHVSNYFLDNNVITSLQSGFTAGDSPVFQLTHLYNFIAKAFDEGKEVKAVFCDISKAFDRVWHKGLLYKLRLTGIDGSLLKWFDSYLGNRTQFTVINGYKSDIKPVLAGVPQGSVLGPLLFLVFINDIVNDIDCNIKLFADDTSLYVIIENPLLDCNSLNRDLETISTWAKTWKVKFNPSKTESILFTRKKYVTIMPDLFMNDVKIDTVTAHKHLGLTLQSDGQWQSQVNEIIAKVSPMINCLRSLKYRLQRKSLMTLYNSFILPIFDYCDYIWINCTKGQELLLEKLHLDALRTICGAVRGVSHSKIYKETGFSTLRDRREMHQMCVFHKIFHNKAPQYLSHLLPLNLSDSSNYNTRSSNILQLPLCRTEFYKRSFLPSAVAEWNMLDENLRCTESMSQFKQYYNLKNICNVHKIFKLHGNRKNQIIHCKLRLGCSDLNGHKFDRFISDTSDCTCGHPYEDSLHYLFQCSQFNQIRSQSFFYRCGFNINTVLFGNPDISDTVNLKIIDSVHDYFTLSARFINSG